jgi:hypothetical protein
MILVIGRFIKAVSIWAGLPHVVEIAAICYATAIDKRKACKQPAPYPGQRMTNALNITTTIPGHSLI